MNRRMKRATRLWLRRLDRKTRDAELRVRCRVLLKVAAGKSRNAAAREVGCVPSTAIRILARFEAHGEAALMDGRSENGRPKVDDVRAGICQILEQSPPDFGFPRPTWTLELLARGARMENGFATKWRRESGQRRRKSPWCSKESGSRCELLVECCRIRERPDASPQTPKACFSALPGIVWVHSLATPDAGRIEIQPAAVEVDRHLEAFAIAEAT